MSDKTAQVDWDDDDFLDMDEYYIKARQLRRELKNLQGANRELGRQLVDVTSNREFWYKEAKDAEIELGHVRQDAQDQNDEVQELWLSLAEAEELKRQLVKAQALLAAAQKAAEWLWGFWDGNTLVAKPGYEDDIREAWGKLLVAVDSADDALVERLATLDAAEAALADCGSRGIYTDFDGPADAIMQMAARIEKLEDESMIEVEVTGKERAEALQAERQLRWEAEQERNWWCGEMRESEERHTRTRIKLAGANALLKTVKQRAERAEALAQLVTPELAELLERLADEIPMLKTTMKWAGRVYLAGSETVDEARTLAARIREALALEASDEG